MPTASGRTTTWPGPGRAGSGSSASRSTLGAWVTAARMRSSLARGPAHAKAGSRAVRVARLPDCRRGYPPLKGST
jgi:hypothetical protein